MPAIPSWLLEPLWDQFAALLPDRPRYAPSHPLGCHRPRVSDRIVFEKLIQVLRFGCSSSSIPGCSCGATTIRERRSESIRAGIFAELKKIARESYDRIVGLALQELAVDGSSGGPGGGGNRRPGPLTGGSSAKAVPAGEGRGIPLGRVLAPATGATPRCSLPRRTSSTTLGRCLMTSQSTSTPATTHRKPATSWKPAA